jgi:hypothetical protein
MSSRCLFIVRFLYCYVLNLSLTFCPLCCLVLWCGTLIALPVQWLLIILCSLFLYYGMRVSKIRVSVIVRLSFVDSVCWSWRCGIFPWCSCVFLCLWFVVGPLCFPWLHVYGLFPVYATHKVSWFCYFLAEYRFLKFRWECSAGLSCIFLGPVTEF